MEIKDCLERGLFCLVYGATGTGKSYMINKIAKDMGYKVITFEASEVKNLTSSGIDFNGDRILYILDNLDLAPKKIQREALKYFVIATATDLYKLPTEYRNIKNKRQLKRPKLSQKINFVRELNIERSLGLRDSDVMYIVENSNNYWDLINNSMLLYASSIDEIPLMKLPEMNPFEEFSSFMKGKITQTKMTETELEIWAMDNTNCNGKIILSLADILLGNNWSGYKNSKYAREVIRLCPIGKITFPKSFRRKPKKEKPKPKPKPKKKPEKKKEKYKTIFDFI